MRLQDFYFVSSGCASYYHHKKLNMGSYILDSSACLLEDFMLTVEQYNNIDYTDFIKVPYSRTKISRNKTYTWNTYNTAHKIDINKTFAYLFAIRGSNRRMERMYPHFEDTEENHVRLRDRIIRTMSTKRIPFFIWQPASIIVDEPLYDVYLRRFLDINYPYKMAVVKPCYGYQTDATILATDYIHEQLVPLVVLKMNKDYNIII